MFIRAMTSGGGGSETLYVHSASSSDITAGNPVQVTNAIGNVKFCLMEYSASGSITHALGCIDESAVYINQGNAIFNKYTASSSVLPLAQNGTTFTMTSGSGSIKPATVMYWSDAES